MHVLNAILRAYPDVAFAIRASVIQGRPASASEEESAGYGYQPYSLDEQLELCRSYITDFIETPCRAILHLPTMAAEYQKSRDIEFVTALERPIGLVEPGSEAEAALDDFLTKVHSYIDRLKPKPPTDDLVKGRGLG
ncbi:hypothetical protein [Rhizobium leguminosarum]|uniref:hypothetical protein n=1 Tax=Rhizobium leguminosarum TaxID=384 RepID=UPI001C95CF14|nr:hypothetical protein [Rhizobium leguminosarum]MBY5700172.1 hypothetical protein [Rhizobium leguminosarum]